MSDKINLSVNFCRAYFRRHFGERFAFGKEYFCNAEKRVETDLAMQKALYERFGDLGLGRPDPVPRLQLGFDDTLNITALFGGQVSFAENYTWLVPGTLASDEAVERLKAPDIETAWPQSLFIRQSESFAGTVGAPVLHGILESALDLRGDAFLVDLMSAPTLANKLLDVLMETVARLKDFWDQKLAGRPQTGIRLGACSCCLVSPEVFEEYLLPRYNALTERFGNGVLCSCGRSTHLLAGYAKLENVATYRLGWETDFRLAREILGPVHIRATLDPARVAAGDASQVEKDVRRLLEETAGGEVTLVLNSAAEDTPDENVRAVFETAKEYQACRNTL